MNEEFTVSVTVPLDETAKRERLLTLAEQKIIDMVLKGTMWDTPEARARAEVFIRENPLADVAPAPVLHKPFKPNRKQRRARK